MIVAWVLAFRVCGIHGSEVQTQAPSLQEADNLHDAEDVQTSNAIVILEELLNLFHRVVFTMSKLLVTY